VIAMWSQRASRARSPTRSLRLRRGEHQPAGDVGQVAPGRVDEQHRAVRSKSGQRSASVSPRRSPVPMRTSNRSVSRSSVRWQWSRNATASAAVHGVRSVVTTGGRATCWATLWPPHRIRTTHFGMSPQDRSPHLQTLGQVRGDPAPSSRGARQRQPLLGRRTHPTPWSTPPAHAADQRASSAVHKSFVHNDSQEETDHGRVG
jgi:hypothetical protein